MKKRTHWVDLIRWNGDEPMRIAINKSIGKFEDMETVLKDIKIIPPTEEDSPLVILIYETEEDCDAATN